MNDRMTVQIEGNGLIFDIQRAAAEGGTVLIIVGISGEVIALPVLHQLHGTAVLGDSCPCVAEGEHILCFTAHGHLRCCQVINRLLGGFIRLGDRGRFLCVQLHIRRDR